MDFFEARDNLINLLCINVDNYGLPAIKRYVHKRYLLWHPDKNPTNPDEYRLNFEKLKDSFDIYCKYKNSNNDSGIFEEPTCSFSPDDLFCDEEIPESSSEEETGSYNESPFDDEFFNASPTKDFAIPEYLKEFFRAKSNRRAGKLFLIFSTQRNVEFSEIFYNLNKNINYFASWTARTNKDICIILTWYQNDWRLIDVKKNIRKAGIQPATVVYAVKFQKVLTLLHNELGTPKFEPFSKEKIKKETQPENLKFNHKKLVDFCISNEINDFFDCMYEYAHLADPCDRKIDDITKEHEDDHTEHVENAKIYVHMSDRKRIAKNACDAVAAKMFAALKNLKNIDFLNEKCRTLGNSLTEENDCETFGLADFYSNYILKLKFKVLATTILAAFIHGVPKSRWVGLRGPYGCGKTSFASGFMKLFEGVSININADRGRLPFYLGSAIGRRFILFDDVKGRQCRYPPLLSTGYGFDNLDDLRDHLDGHIAVQLEKKNQNPINQVFPCGIITCNMYIIPPALKERIKFFLFKTDKELYKKHPVSVSMETIFIALVLNDLLPVESHVRSHIIKKRDEWWRMHNQTCSCHKVSMVWVVFYQLSQH